jgi:chemotaxis protein methyltransferase CheR
MTAPTPTKVAAASNLGLPASASPSISAADFTLVSDLVRTKAAIVLEPGKEYLVESRLAPIARADGYGSVTEVIAALRRRTPGLDAKIVDALTTNETSWFRDLHPWDALKTVLIPELIERRRATRELSIWCGAASSGQEPYSLCMMLREHFPELTGWRLRIVASEISPTMLDRCRAGRYSQLEMNRGLPASLLVRYFEKQGAEWVLKPEIRQMIELKSINLAEPVIGLPPCDLVMMRNVLIYFDRTSKRQVLSEIRKVLRPDGILMLGSSETTMNIDDRWSGRTINKTIVYTPS